jgi:hypothetical protein
MAVDIDSEKAALERDIETLLYEFTKRTGRIAVSLDTTEVRIPDGNQLLKYQVRIDLNRTPKEARRERKPAFFGYGRVNGFKVGISRT